VELLKRGLDVAEGLLHNRAVPGAAHHGEVHLPLAVRDIYRLELPNLLSRGPAHRPAVGSQNHAMALWLAACREYGMLIRLAEAAGATVEGVKGAARRIRA
jgi:hypothetical protein